MRRKTCVAPDWPANKRFARDAGGMELGVPRRFEARAATPTGDEYGTKGGFLDFGKKL
jgi:hypothetical protein